MWVGKYWFRGGCWVGGGFSVCYWRWEGWVSRSAQCELYFFDIIIEYLCLQFQFRMKYKVNTRRYFSSTKEFTFLKDIGIGSFGSVKLALHVETNKCYAVKIVQINSKMSDNELLILEREINIHMNIDHPHIIKLWDVLTEDDRIYMIMELAENGTLFTYQNKNPHLSEPEIYKFFNQTLNSIKYLHGKDIMHRDIKPENILLDQNYNVKICDLGWATDKIEMKRKTFCGTYEYMAPEMVFEKQYNYTIDIWALGVLLYELVHGYAPFPAKNLEDIKQKIKVGYYELGNTINKDLKSLLIEILQFQSEKRPTLKKVLTHQWIENMKRQIKSQLTKFKTDVKQQNTKRAHVKNDDKIYAKKHNRYDSLMNQQDCTGNFKNSYLQCETMLSTAIPSTMEKMMSDQQQEMKKKAKKKCKTQGQESMEKIFTDAVKQIKQTKTKVKKEKENIKFHPHDLAKTAVIYKNDSSGNLHGNFKMKRIAEKLNELTNKYPIEKKKQQNRLKTQKEE